MSKPPPLPWKLRTGPERLVLLFAAASAVVGGLFLALHRTGLARPVCMWKSFTGLPCAGCGGTRALDSLLRGDVAGACLLNPAAVAGVLFLAVLTLYSGGVLLFRWEPLRPVWLHGRAWRAVFIAAIAVNWIYLLLAGRL